MTKDAILYTFLFFPAISTPGNHPIVAPQPGVVRLPRHNAVSKGHHDCQNGRQHSAGVCRRQPPHLGVPGPTVAMPMRHGAQAQAANETGLQTIN